MSYSILKKKKKQHILVIFKLFIGWKGVETLDVIYWVTCMYKLIIYRHLDSNKISVIKDNTFNNLRSLNTL
jgi:hypothetical protein